MMNASEGALSGLEVCECIYAYVLFKLKNVLLEHSQARKVYDPGFNPNHASLCKE